MIVALFLLLYLTLDINKFILDFISNNRYK